MRSRGFLKFLSKAVSVIRSSSVLFFFFISLSLFFFLILPIDCLWNQFSFGRCGLAAFFFKLIIYMSFYFFVLSLVLTWSLIATDGITEGYTWREIFLLLQGFRSVSSFVSSFFFFQFPSLLLYLRPGDCWCLEVFLNWRRFSSTSAGICQEFVPHMLSGLVFSVLFK